MPTGDPLMFSVPPLELPEKLPPAKLKPNQVLVPVDAKVPVVVPANVSANASVPNNADTSVIFVTNFPTSPPFLSISRGLRAEDYARSRPGL